MLVMQKEQMDIFRETAQRSLKSGAGIKPTPFKMVEEEQGGELPPVRKGLVIRKEQMEIFRQAALLSFENEMVAHSQNFSPELSNVLGEEQLRLAIRGAMAHADSYGFTNRGPIRLFIELMFLFGSTFDTDPQYPWAASILRDTSDQMQRAEHLYEKVLDYQGNVSGPDDLNTRVALGNISLLTQQPLTYSSNDFAPGMLRAMAYIYPKKAAYLGEEALQALIRESYVVAQAARFPTSRGYAMMVVLMYMFGHGCADDPLYPWIANTLRDGKIIDSGVRAERLEKKALTWLDHVLTNTREGTQA